jgi:hypothetical protein
MACSLFGIEGDPAIPLRRHLGNLLAVIHRDGGHYRSEHGDEKATSDAIAAVLVMRQEREELLGALSQLVWLESIKESSPVRHDRLRETAWWAARKVLARIGVEPEEESTDVGF